jgi:hypothetical protein
LIVKCRREVWRIFHTGPTFRVEHYDRIARKLGDLMFTPTCSSDHEGRSRFGK